MENNFHNSREAAQRLDAQDELRHFREKFLIPEVAGKEQVYFLGNSLGLQPRGAQEYVGLVMQQWHRFGVEGFFMGEDPWLHYHDSLVEPLAHIVGAKPHEVVVMNQLTVNLHLMLVSFYRPQGKRVKILCEAKAFPSDQYMLETHLRHRNLNPEEVLIEVQPRPGEVCIRQEDIELAIEQNKNELALVLWGGVNYYSGQVFDMAAITRAAHNAGARVGFDLAHAAGNVLLHLHQWNVDFACWCSYKYLNSGPGAVAGCFVHERYHTNAAIQRFAGWWGYRKETRFLMQKGFEPIASAEGWQLSTPSPVLYALHKASLEIFKEAGMQRLHKKGQQLSSYLLFLLHQINKDVNYPVTVITPEKEQEKGCQVSLLLPQAGKSVFNYLTQNGVFADWREPDVIRVAPVPLYNTFEEVWTFSRLLHEALQQTKK